MADRPWSWKLRQAERNRESCLNYVRENPGCTRADVRHAVGLNGATVCKHLNDLIADGAVSWDFTGSRFQRLWAER